MNILIVSQYFWPENFRVNDLAKDLKGRGHNVYVLTSYPNYPDGIIYKEFTENKESYNSYHGVQVLRAPSIPRGNKSWNLILNYFSFALSATFYGLWKFRAHKIDSVFFFAPSPITSSIPAIALKKYHKAKLTIWVLDIWPDILTALGITKSKLVIKPLDLLVRYIYRNCDNILAQSKSFIPRISEQTKNIKNISYFPSWSDSVLPATAEPYDFKIDWAKHFNVVFAGNIGESQDFPSILAAAKCTRNHKRLRWIIVGDGRMSAWVSKEIVKNSLENSVIQLGRHPIESMPSLFKNADALLVSLKNEPVFSMTIPGKLQSYLASGKPILAMLNGEGGKIVSESNAGLACSSGDYKALADNAIHLSDLSGDELESMGVNGLKYSNEEFNRHTLLTKLEEFLQ